jgi:hypothetical protein
VDFKNGCAENPPATAQHNMRSRRRPILCTNARILRGSAATSKPGKPHLNPQITGKLLTVPEALFRRESVPLSMRGCMESMTIKQHSFWARPCTPAHFCGAITHIGRFVEPKARGWVHRGRTGAAADLGATLAGSSDCKQSKMRACSGRPLSSAFPHFFSKKMRKKSFLIFFLFFSYPNLLNILCPLMDVWGAKDPNDLHVRLCYN